MLDYITLSAKPYIEKNNEKYKDLLSKVIDNNINTNTIIQCSLIEVTDEYVARPDLVSLAVYGSDKYADIICKINGISNPFELNSGMELIIPNLNEIQQVFIYGKKSSVVNDDKTTHISKTTKTNQKAKNSDRKPSEQTIGEYNFTIDRINKIIYY